MTFASKITLSRLLLVPVFAVLAIYYGHSVADKVPIEWLRWCALAVFITAAASDGLDGWIARRFNKRSRFGAIIDPIADKTLLLTAIITLTLVNWGHRPPSQHRPPMERQGVHRHTNGGHRLDHAQGGAVLPNLSLYHRRRLHRMVRRGLYPRWLAHPP